MKKSIIVMMVAVLLISALFVSCKQEIATPQDSMGTVRISLASARNLTPDTPVSNIPVVTNWYYVATKTDGSYYKTGETEWASLAAMEENQQVGTFSTGEWSFSFYGYASAQTTKPSDPTAAAVYYSESIPLTVSRGTENPIDVVLQVGGGIAFGKLNIHDIPIPEGLTLKLSIDGETEREISMPEEIDLTAEGVHTYEFKMYSGNEPVGSGKTSITVSKGYNYGITGTISSLEAQGIVVIGTVEYRKAVASVTQYVEDDGLPIEFTTTAAPDGAETIVEFGAGALSEGSHTLTTVVSGYEDVGSFVVESGNPIAAIDLSLEDGATFTGTATVTTYIAKGLTSNPTVSYNGDGAQPTFVSYDDDTGELVFTTTHFSQFIVAYSAAIIVSDGTTYASLADFATAVNSGNSFAGKTVYLLQDVNLQNEAWTPIGTAHRKNADMTKVFSGTFDGKGHKISNLSSAGYNPVSNDVDADEYTVGLFGYVKGGTVKNVILENVSISRYGSFQLENAGGVVGYLDGGTVVNCSVIGTSSVSGFNGIGGVVGRAYGTCTIENCTNTATVYGSKNVAGIVGFVNPLASGTIKVLNCTNSGNVSRVDGALANEGAAAGIACYGCSDSNVTDHATSNLYISGNVCDENAQITNVTATRVGRINFLTSHGPTTTTGTVSVQ